MHERFLIFHYERDAGNPSSIMTTRKRIEYSFVKFKSSLLLNANANLIYIKEIFKCQIQQQLNVSYHKMTTTKNVNNKLDKITAIQDASVVKHHKLVKLSQV